MSANYKIRCECGEVGIACGKHRGIVDEVSSNFEWSEQLSDARRALCGRKLVCKACGNTPDAIANWIVSV